MTTDRGEAQQGQAPPLIEGAGVEEEARELDDEKLASVDDEELHELPGISYEGPSESGADSKKYDSEDMFLAVGVTLFGTVLTLSFLPDWIRKPLLSEHGSGSSMPPYLLPCVSAVVGILCLSLVMLHWISSKRKEAESERERTALESAADRLREKMELPSLVSYNQALLDRYHGLATDQADKAYRSSRYAMGVGLMLLVGAVGIGWQDSAQGDRLFIGSAAAVGTAFSGYLSRTYMQTYDRALGQLNRYFDQPVLNGNFLTAERMSESLPEEHRVAMMETVIAQVLENGLVMQNDSRSRSAKTVTPRRRARRRGSRTS